MVKTGFCGKKYGIKKNIVKILISSCILYLELRNES